MLAAWKIALSHSANTNNIINWKNGWKGWIGKKGTFISHPSTFRDYFNENFNWDRRVHGTTGWSNKCQRVKLMECSGSDRRCCVEWTDSKQWLWNFVGQSNNYLHLQLLLICINLRLLWRKRYRMPYGNMYNCTYFETLEFDPSIFDFVEIHFLI